MTGKRPGDRIGADVGRPAAGPAIAADRPRFGYRSGGRISLRTLILIRWVAVAGQLVTVLGAHYVLGYQLPIVATLAVIGVSVLLNLAAVLQGRTRVRLEDRDAAFYLAYDEVQLAVLLSLTGGLLNPFCMLLLAPLTVAATILSRRSIIRLTALTLLCTAVLALWHYPLPGPAEIAPASSLYQIGVWLALSVSAIFVAAYVRNVSEEARRVGDALAASQMALAREQRVSALGALAAAAAHELGSPLGTIAVIAKELARELPPDGPWAEDLALLSSQTERCRQILAELARRPEIDGGAPYERLSLPALVEAAAQPFQRPGIALRIEEPAPAADGSPPVVVRRAPELLHGLGSLLQNAIQFARREVTVRCDWTADEAHITIADDGPGFPPGLLSRIGEPYLSVREGDEDGTLHMGLGIFIATTLLEHSGAQLSFANGRDGGAVVAVRWPRIMFEA